MSSRNNSVVELEEYLEKARMKLAELEPDYKKAQIEVSRMLRYSLVVAASLKIGTYAYYVFCLSE